MSESTFDKEAAMNDNADNLTPEANASEEALAKELNTDDSVSGTQHLNDSMEEAESENEKLKRELGEAKDKYLRLMAEFENYKKRSSKEFRDMSQTAGREIIQSLLDVVDDSKRAAKQMEASNDLETIKQGVSLVFNKLHHTLQQKGLKEMECMKADFDSDLHEAITEIPAGNEEMVGKVMDVVQPGYYLNDKLIRHAKVVVGK